MSAEYEWGYRLNDGTDWWQVDHGSDGVWIPEHWDHRIAHIDVWSNGEKTAHAIRRELVASGFIGVPIRRQVFVTYGPVEEVE